jgi:hypothetical protein
MPNAFISAHRKVDWAKRHLAKFKRVVRCYFAQQDLYSIFAEPDPNDPKLVVYKLRFAKEPPWFLSEMVGDVASNLRSALDHAMYAVSTAAACKKRFRHASFPFAYDPANFENSLRGNCADVPQEIYPLLRSYEPYKGGSEALWALHQIRSTNEHAIIVPIGAAAIEGESTMRATGFVRRPYNLTWDSAKNEMELLTAAWGVKIHLNFKFGGYIAFSEIDSVAGDSVIPDLDLFADMVETIIAEIEAETRRLGFKADL